MVIDDLILLLLLYTNTLHDFCKTCVGVGGLRARVCACVCYARSAFRFFFFCATTRCRKALASQRVPPADKWAGFGRGDVTKYSRRKSPVVHGHGCSITVVDVVPSRTLYASTPHKTAADEIRNAPGRLGLSTRGNRFGPINIWVVYKTDLPE